MNMSMSQRHFFILFFVALSFFVIPQATESHNDASAGVYIGNPTDQDGPGNCSARGEEICDPGPRIVNGQAWKVEWNIDVNDNPSPTVVICINQNGQLWTGYCETIQQQGGGNAPSSGFIDIGNAEDSYRYMRVRVTVHGTISNPNDFAGSFTVKGREMSYGNMTINPDFIEVGETSVISWSGAHGTDSWVTISGSGSGTGTFQKGADLGGPFSRNHNYVAGAPGTKNVESCIRGPNSVAQFVEACDTGTIEVANFNPPTVDVLCNGGNGPCTIQEGDYVTISWTSNGASSCWTQGTTYGGWAPRDPVNRNGSEDYNPSVGNHIFRVLCGNQAGQVQDQVTVVVTNPQPTVDILCNGTQGPCSATYGSNVPLSWTSTLANTCNASGAWSGAKATSGTENRTITSTGTYTLSCTGPTGTGQDSVTVNMVCPATAPVGLSTTLITSHNARLNWTPGTGGSRQLLRVGPNQADVLSGCAGGTCVVVENNLASNVNFYQIPPTTLQASTLYYWRIVNFFDPGVCWAEGNSQFTTLANIAPTTSNVRATEPDYCVFGPSIIGSWTYSDPEGTPQRAYQIQADDNAGFSSPNFDSGKIISNATTHFISTGLTWNTTYRIRVRTWDTPDLPSAWTIQSLCTGPPGNPSGCSGDQKSWQSPKNQYPNNMNTFTWTPTRPTINQPVQFDDGNITCYKTPPNTVDTCLRWDWTWGDGSPGVNQQSPTHTYTANGVYNVSLRAQDQQNGYACTGTKQITIQKPIPNWREVLPR